MNDLQNEPAMEDDVWQTAGWLYADLFLGLMVIFLASVSFVPMLTSDSKLPPLTPSNSILPSNPQTTRSLYLSYKVPSAVQLQKDIHKFLAEKKLPQNTAIAMLEITGGYLARGETSAAGLGRATKFALAPRTQDANFIQSVTVGLNTSSRLKLSDVEIRVTFANQ